MNCKYIGIALAVFVAGCDGGTDTAIDDAIEQHNPSNGVSDLPVRSLREAAKAEGFEITVTDVSQRSQIGTEGLGPAAAEGETFVVVRYTLKNIGKKPVNSFEFPSIDLMDGDGQVYARDSEASVLESVLSEDTTGSGDLNPNITAKLIDVWKVDKVSFDQDNWRMKVSFGSAIADAVAWPLDSDSPPPLIFALK